MQHHPDGGQYARESAVSEGDGVDRAVDESCQEIDFHSNSQAE